jgi:hypothetical protein
MVDNICIMTELNWGPTEKQIKDIASAGLNQSKKKDVKVCVYWENDPNLMIFDPVFFAKTEYINRKYTTGDRSIEVIIGKID